MAPIELQGTTSTLGEANRYCIRALASGDYAHLRRLEAEIWSGDPSGQLCCYYLRLCTELYPEWCFIAMDGDRPVGYVLNFPKGKVNYCATLAVHPDFQKTRVNYLLIRAMVKKLLVEEMEECRFLVEPDNSEARSVHEALGARVVAEVRDYYHAGDRRLWSVIRNCCRISRPWPGAGTPSCRSIRDKCWIPPTVPAKSCGWPPSVPTWKRPLKPQEVSRER